MPRRLEKQECEEDQNKKERNKNFMKIRKQKIEEQELKRYLYFRRKINNIKKAYQRIFVVKRYENEGK